MDSLLKQLEQVGLSPKAAALYVALLQLGSGTIQDIASRAGLVRTTCYPLIEDLQKKGLVTTTRSGKKTIYLAEPPGALLASIEKMGSLARAIVPTLAHVLAGNSKRPKIEIYEGTSGVWQAYEDVIRGEKYEVKAFLPADDAVLIATDRKIREYIRRRVHRKIKMRAIMQKTPLIEKEYVKYDKGDLRESRFIDAKHFPIPVEIDLYPENSIAITSFKDGLGLVIRSKPIYTALNSIFELLWLSAEIPRRRK